MVRYARASRSTDTCRARQQYPKILQYELYAMNSLARAGYVTRNEVNRYIRMFYVRVSAVFYKETV